MAGEAEQLLECAICLQQCMQPVQLPCSHVFCFLCAKGTALQSKRCALCRASIPRDFIKKPFLFKKSETSAGGSETDTRFVWFYEGHNGWWQYDERTCSEIEAAYSSGAASVDVLIAGSVYVVDFANQVQFQRHRTSRKRRIKRDVATANKKGVAGLQSDVPAEPSAASVSVDDVRMTDSSSAADCISVPSTSSVNDDSADIPRQVPVGQNDYSSMNTATAVSQLAPPILQRSVTEPLDAVQPDLHDVVSLTRHLSC